MPLARFAVSTRDKYSTLNYIHRQATASRFFIFGFHISTCVAHGFYHLIQLDTNVVSELRRKKPYGAVLAWLESVDDKDLYLCSVTLAEIQTGIELTRDRDPQRAQELEEWLDAVEVTYTILVLDGVAFRAWAKLMHKKSDTLYEDAMIAAIAQVNKLIVVTRNITDFESFDVGLLNPFEYQRE